MLNYAGRVLYYVRDGRTVEMYRDAVSLHGPPGTETPIRWLNGFGFPGRTGSLPLVEFPPVSSAPTRRAARPTRGIPRELADGHVLRLFPDDRAVLATGREVTWTSSPPS